LSEKSGSLFFYYICICNMPRNKFHFHLIKKMKKEKRYVII